MEQSPPPTTPKQSKPTLVFASTSPVYGEPTKTPTPETYAPLKPISTYGATKLACEALISAYAHTYSFTAIPLHLARSARARDILCHWTPILLHNR